MMKTLKYLLIAVLVLPILIIAVLAALLFSVNPNTLVPVIEEQLLAQNIEAKFKGDIAWSLYPNIGLSIAEVELRQKGDTSKQALAQIGEARFSVKLAPLLKKQIQVNGISLNNSSVFLHVDKSGNSNWQDIAATEEQAPANEAPPQENPDAALPEIEIEDLNLQIDSLSYQDEQNDTKVTVTGIELQGEGVNIEGEFFPLSAKLKAKMNDLPATTIALTSKLAIQPNVSILQISPFELRLTPSGYQGKAISIQGSTKMNYGEDLAAKGEIELASVNLASLLKALEIELPETADKNAFSKLSFKTPYEFLDNTLNLNKTQIVFDQSTLSGETKVSLKDDPDALPAIRSHWQMDRIVVDNYLAPPSESTSEPPAAEAAEATELPFEILEQLDVDASLNINSLVYSGEPIEQGKLSLKSKRGVSTFNADIGKAYDSQLSIDGKLTSRNNKAKLEVDGKSENINIGKLVTSFAEIENISGAAKTQFSAKSSGSTDLALIDNLNADFSLESTQLVLNPINIEQQYCKAIALLEQKSFDNSQWEDFTKLSPITLKANYREGTVRLQSFAAQVQTLITNASGSLNLDSSEFKFPIELSLNNTAETSKRCSIISDKWKNRAIPLVCKGNLNKLGINTCLPDTSVIKKLIQDKVEARIDKEEEKIEKKIEEKREEAKEKAKDKIEEEASKLIDKETGDKLEEAWKNLIKKRE